MATATMATAAGAAALLYYTLNKKVETIIETEDDDANSIQRRRNVRLGIDRVSNRLIQAPGTWLETISTLSETLRFTYSETLGKWPIGDLAFGINFLLKRQGNLRVCSVFGGKDSTQLTGANEPKAGILKPAFTILVDHKTKSFLLLIRGTHSIKDTLTAATGAVVPFHHSVVHEGGVSNLVLGYAHGGMVAAARWIAKLAIPSLTKGLDKYPDYKLKIVGHSLGGGTAALLTFVMRERKEWSTACCVAFAPAACMTWELADSCNEFITTVINGADLVPTFSAASMDDLRTEVTASAWINDLRNQIEQTRILSTVYRSATALGSRLPSIASARAKVAGAGAMLRPVSSGTQVVMKRAQSMAQSALSRPSLQISSWSCMGPRHRPKPKAGEDSEESSSSRTEASQPLVRSPEKNISTGEAIELPVSSEGMVWDSEVSEKSGLNEVDIDGHFDLVGQNTNEDGISEVELWRQLEGELYDPVEGDEANITKEIREEEAEAVAEISEIEQESSVPDTKEVHRFLPPGKIMHIVSLHLDEPGDETDSRISADTDNSRLTDTKVGIFLTSRSLYSKLRLSRTMIADHFMPVYRKQIERLIEELETEDTVVNISTGDEAEIQV
ncbi:Sn1-specific diacylglycerol lipase alpha [Heracleum sosnowskyi]|uniref:Sn1-specific diacylglycerol lipase alpha n=1 Tax=Heracleum sosnowskyi TaxID=360622 RepID=A0AAD8H4K4_9APIA|nr:Sn1-specific diacylglycerol lipase alpha [Heracleum sosnowskyi]